MPDNNPREEDSAEALGARESEVRSSGNRHTSIGENGDSRFEEGDTSTERREESVADVSPAPQHKPGLEVVEEEVVRATGIALPATFAAFEHRNYRLYWFGNLASLIGTWMQNIATGWLVLTLTNSPFFVGLNSTLAWLPAWFVSLPAGAMADRFDKRRMMILTQSVLALFALVLAVLYWTHVLTIYYVLAISCLTGFAATMNGPIAQTLVPDLVGRKNVLNAIALNNAMFNSARIIGPAIAGVLLGTIGAGGCFGINSASFLAIIGALWFIQLPPREPHRAEESVWHQILAGLRFVAGHPDIRILVVLTAVFSSFGMIYLPLMPVFARDVFHQGAREYGVMMTCVGIGAVAGGLTLATISKTRRKGVILTLGTAGIGLSSIALSLVRDIRLALPLIAIIGFCQTSITSLMNTLIQTIAPEHIRGRALSVYMLAFNGMFPLGCLLGGAIAQRFGAPAATLVGGCAVLVSLGAVSVLAPSLRRL
ncbi:MAG TPA: MFS transporter [bacterium]|nr:MFS transporter [bacterium]